VKNGWLYGWYLKCIDSILAPTPLLPRRPQKALFSTGTPQKQLHKAQPHWQRDLPSVPVFNLTEYLLGHTLSWPVFTNQKWQVLTQYGFLALDNIAWIRNIIVYIIRVQQTFCLCISVVSKSNVPLFFPFQVSHHELGLSACYALEEQHSGGNLSHCQRLALTWYQLCAFLLGRNISC
jgi:hypothetical protein